jgi:glycosyltransferase involved in cell wall biosynthesis
MLNQRRSIEDRRSVLYFTNSMLWGGVEEHVCGLLRKLSRRLFRAHLVCDPTIYERFRAASPLDVDITPLALSSPRHVAAALRFARLLVRGQFQIVHSHMFWSSLFASPIAWACRVPIIVETLHGTEAWRTGWKANCKVDRATTRFVSKYVAVCESDARFLGNKKHVPERKIAIIHNGVDTRRFAVPQDARSAIRHALGFTEADFVLIMVARLHPGKGHRVLLDAMRQLLHFYPKLKLICLGEGEGEPELRALRESFGLAHCIRLVGHQQNVPEWLAAADVNVLPSFYEGLPLTILEAMASGLPTVASNVGGIPEAIEDGISGLLVPPGNPYRLAEAVSLLLRDTATRVRIGRAAHARILQSFVLEQQVSSTEKMYLDLSGALTDQSAENTDYHLPRLSDDWSSPPIPEPSARNNLSEMCVGVHERHKATRL